MARAPSRPRGLNLAQPEQTAITVTVTRSTDTSISPSPSSSSSSPSSSMSHHRTYTCNQHSYVVNIDAGSFANIEIVVGGHHHGGVWPPPRAVTATPENQSYSYAKRSTFVPLQSQSPPSPVPATRSPTNTRSKPVYEWEHVATQRHMTEGRARDQQQRTREEARLAEARRAAAEEAQRRAQKQQQQALREERRRQEHIRRGRELSSAWRTYEARWALLSQRQPELGLLSALTFERIPWPVAGTPLDRTLDVLRPEAIREFLLSPTHSPDVPPKDRIRAALRRWHPDKFARVLTQVMESDRDAVTEGMGIVVRCLNGMLERENRI